MESIQTKNRITFILVPTVELLALPTYMYQITSFKCVNLIDVIQTYISFFNHTFYFHIQALLIFFARTKTLILLFFSSLISWYTTATQGIYHLQCFHAYTLHISYHVFNLDTFIMKFHVSVQKSFIYLSKHMFRWDFKNKISFLSEKGKRRVK